MIRGKNNQLNYKGRQGILVLCSGTSSWDPVELFSEPNTSVDLVINTYPKELIGIILTNHHYLSGIERDPRVETKENKILIELNPAVQEYEATIIWKNSYGSLSFPEEIVQAFEEYQQNLADYERSLLFVKT